MNWILDVGFVAKASSFTPRPSVLYLEAQMSATNVSWVDKEVTHFHEPKVHKEVGACQRVERASLLICGLERMSRIKKNEVALHETL